MFGQLKLDVSTPEEFQAWVKKQEKLLNDLVK